MYTRYSILFFTIVLLLTGLYFAYAQKSYPSIPDDLVFQRSDGVKQSLVELKGKPLLVSFWSPSCAICMHEVKDFNRLYRSQQGGQRFELLAQSMYFDRPDQVIASSRAAGMTYPVYLDLDNSVSRAFGEIDMTPTSFLLDQQGKVVYRHTGPLDYLEIVKRLQQLTG